MVIKEDGLFLKKIKMGRLEPALQQEILELAAMMGHETTTRASSNLHFLFKLYQAEKAKEKKSRKALKKAEELILRLVDLHHESVRAGTRRQRAKGKRRKPKLTPLEIRLPLSRKTKEMLESIGITDEKDMETVVGILGDEKVEERVGLITITKLGDELIKRIFGMHTEVLTVAKDDDFIALLESMENKKEMIDAWMTANKSDPPPLADYREKPEILLEDYKHLADMLRLEMPAEKIEVPEEKTSKYRGKPMHPRDFIKVIEAMGFTKVREANHGDLFENEEGAIVCVQKAHRSQMQLNRSVVKKKLTEAGVNLDQFHEVRAGLGL